MKIAIIGSGFFGSTIALKLSENKKYAITIFEKHNKILQNASKKNQMRFHLGYHYPRSKKTVNEIKKSNKDFKNFYGNSILGNTLNYYSISKKKTKTSLKKYTNFLIRNNLSFKKINNSNFFSSKIDGSFITSEKTLNYNKLYKIVNKRLKKKNIKIKKKTTFLKKDLLKFDKVIICAYQNNNIVLQKLGYKPKYKYRYELVEKIIVKLPSNFKNKSFIVLDGQFVCVDPLLNTGYHLLSSVKFSKIEVLNSMSPKFKNYRKIYVDSDRVKNLKISRFKDFIEDGSKYLPFLKKAKYITSYYIVRTIKSNKEKTDERTNEITKINNKVITILSGKWNTCVSIAKQVQRILNK